MIREPPRSKRNYTLFPFTPLFRSVDGVDAPGQARQRYLRIERDRQFARNGRRPHRRFDRLDAPVRYRVDGRGAVPRTRRYERWGRRWRRGAMSDRSEEHTSELQSLMRISYAVFCLQKQKNRTAAKETLKPKNTLKITKTQSAKQTITIKRSR